ncbi:MAG: hypothetical protein WAW96_18080 [Alphaproteobacteria bacterium]
MGEGFSARAEVTIVTGDAKMMTLYSADNSKLMEVSALEIEGNQLLIKGKIFGAMPMTAKLRPEELRKLFGMLNFKLIFFLLTFPFRKGGSQ